ncbi:hypothetical protein PR048_013845 [Dryococelus australis]|uniref:Uncharacterized protein n=1 Tax=Dryococelus australis TaxID=614101 RepID=A0ABQ9HTC1_9NEOP|nr:hypothetical protein PR048_013845 [Dryococelus australis]
MLGNVVMFPGISLERGAKPPKEKSLLTRHADSAERAVDSSRSSSSSTLPRSSSSVSQHAHGTSGNSC